MTDITPTDSVLQTTLHDDALERYRSEFISSALSIGALKFGSFVLKSGR